VIISLWRQQEVVRGVVPKDHDVEQHPTEKVTIIFSNVIARDFVNDHAHVCHHITECRRLAPERNGIAVMRERL